MARCSAVSKYALLLCWAGLCCAVPGCLYWTVRDLEIEGKPTVQMAAGEGMHVIQLEPI